MSFLVSAVSTAGGALWNTGGAVCGVLGKVGGTVVGLAKLGLEGKAAVETVSGIGNAAGSLYRDVRDRICPGEEQQIDREVRRIDLAVKSEEKGRIAACCRLVKRIFGVAKEGTDVAGSASTAYGTYQDAKTKRDAADAIRPSAVRTANADAQTREIDNRIKECDLTSRQIQVDAERQLAEEDKEAVPVLCRKANTILATATPLVSFMEQPLTLTKTGADTFQSVLQTLSDVVEQRASLARKLKASEQIAENALAIERASTQYTLRGIEREDQKADSQHQTGLLKDAVDREMMLFELPFNKQIKQAEFEQKLFHIAIENELKCEELMRKTVLEKLATAGLTPEQGFAKADEWIAAARNYVNASVIMYDSNDRVIRATHDAANKALDFQQFLFQEALDLRELMHTEASEYSDLRTHALDEREGLLKAGKFTVLSPEEIRDRKEQACKRNLAQIHQKYGQQGV